MELYIVRHGETDFNRKRIIQGRGVNAPINAKGEEQARQFHAHFQDYKFDQVFCSNLLRTQQTLQPFTQSGYEVQPTELLDEIDWGIHEGKSPSLELRDEYMKVIRNWQNGQLDDKIDGGESPNDVQLRMRTFLDGPYLQGKQVLICSHGRAMRILLCTLLDQPLTEMEEFPHTNLSLYKLRRDGGKFSIELFNFTDHLEQIVS